MRNNKIQVRRKKPKNNLTFRVEQKIFLFCSVYDKGMDRRCGTSYCLKEFGYHIYFPNVFVVFHLLSGIPIQSYSEEKKARIKAKRLETGMDKIDRMDDTLQDWSTTTDEVPF